MQRPSQLFDDEQRKTMPVTAEKTRAGYIREFDGLRGVLALWIVLVHAMLFSGLLFQLPQNLPGHVARYFMKGQHGVAVFFILSGFVVSMQLKRRQTPFAHFMKSRFLRIYPLYLLSLGLALFSVFLMPDILQTGSWFQDAHFESMHSVSSEERTHLHWHLLFHLLLIHAAIPNAWFPEAHWAILAPAWSLSHEWQFYMIAPRLRKAASSPAGLITVTILAVGAARLAARMHLGLEWSILATLPMFLVGILTFQMHERLGSQPEVPASQAILPLCGLTAFAFMANWKVLPIAFWTLIYAAVIVSQRPVESTAWALPDFLSKVFRSRAARWLGSISYPLYLVHWPFMIIVLYIALKVAPNLTSTQAFGIFAAMSPALLWLCNVIHRSVETPLLALGKKSSPGTAQTPAPLSKTVNYSAQSH